MGKRELCVGIGNDGLQAETESHELILSVRSIRLKLILHNWIKRARARHPRFGTTNAKFSFYFCSSPSSNKTKHETEREEQRRSRGKLALPKLCVNVVVRGKCYLIFQLTIMGYPFALKHSE